MGIAENQARTFLRLVAQLRPHWRHDTALPARIQSLLAADRRLGSRDRRLYRELLYTTLRHLPWIEPHLADAPAEAVRWVAWLAAETPATRAFCAVHAVGSPPAGDRAELLPAWFRAHCPALFEGVELEAQLRRAPLWLRLQTDEPGVASVLAELTARGWQWRRSTAVPDAVEVLSEADVTGTEAWRQGRCEVQDLGSQMILASIGIEPGGNWLDACAGAGGKALQLARLLGPGARVAAHDPRTAALAELQRRALRAGQRIELLPEISPDARYDGVLVDAPCSGSGTWRRAPHLKWTTSETTVLRGAEKQLALLQRFSRNVGPHGRLVYATCSLSRRENEDVVRAFLSSTPDFARVPFTRTFGFEPGGQGLTVLPSRHDTDGFFVASLRRGIPLPPRAPFQPSACDS